MPAADATRATAMRDSFKWDFARGLSFFSLSWSCNYFLFLNLHVTLHSSCYLCIFLFSLHAAFHSSLCPLSAWEEEATSFVHVSTLVSQPLAPVRCLPFISFFSLWKPLSPFHFPCFSRCALSSIQGTSCVCWFTWSQTLWFVKTCLIVPLFLWFPQTIGDLENSHLFSVLASNIRYSVCWTLFDLIPPAFDKLMILSKLADHDRGHSGAGPGHRWGGGGGGVYHRWGGGPGPRRASISNGQDHSAQPKGQHWGARGFHHYLYLSLSGLFSKGII